MWFRDKVNTIALQITVNGQKIGEQEIPLARIHEAVNFLIVHPTGLQLNHVQFAVRLHFIVVHSIVVLMCRFACSL